MMQSPLLTAVLADGSLLMDDVEIGFDDMFPDWNTLRALPHQPGHAHVMCFVKERGIWDGKGFRRCPRSRLLEFTDNIKAKHNLDFLVGVEIEFFIMEASKDVLPAAPVQTNPHIFSPASLRNEYMPVLAEIVSALTKVGIMVRQFHTEGKSMFEISTEPLPALQAADALIYSQEAIRTICYNHGLHATMHPKPFEKLGGVGSHMHLSISWTEKEEAFLAGLLESWASLAAFYMPSFDSYARVRPGEAGEYVCWGMHNRTANIRKMKAGHWELRSVDGTANPYLTLLAILNAGMLGLEQDQELVMKDPVLKMYPGIKTEHTLEEKDYGQYGIKDKMPTSLKDSLELLKKNETLLEAIGPEIMDRYVKVKTKEEENFSKLTRAERMELSVRIH
ncbi:fluG [Hyphodiscus hymeniophilus]|uniref:FluG n=1 Tax=Hyphodiscus hymeniophilus TaxID=353542 RepID=A0A9P6VMN4_9HELO|nr:fluG [Hyphodiscus hymeniophilus]